jgi:hypothetical protein
MFAGWRWGFILLGWYSPPVGPMEPCREWDIELDDEMDP